MHRPLSSGVLASALFALLFALLLPAPADAAGKGFGLLGDSTSDEYRADDNRGGAYAAVTFNWAEQLFLRRRLDFGPWGTRGEPRRGGFAYNWARSGATARSLVTSGQHTGLAAQVAAGQVSFVFISIGNNDFNLANGTYREIYDGSLSGAALLAKISGVVADITAAVDTILAAGPEGIVLTTVPDPGVAVDALSRYPVAAWRQRVTDAIDAVNAGLAGLAQARGIALFDVMDYYRTVLLPRIDADGNLNVNGELITILTKGNEPHHLLLDDEVGHSGTVIGGLLANAWFVEPLNARYAAGIAPLTEVEILEIAGIDSAPRTVTLTVTVIGNGTVTADRGAIDCGAICRDTYPAGATVMLTAAPDAGADFAGWSGSGCFGTGVCTVTLDGKARVTATFAAVPADARVPGDWDGDGRPDLIWRHRGGANLIASCDDASLLGLGRLPALPPPWEMVAADDINGDHRMDLVWRHPVNGLVLAAYFDGTGLLGYDAVLSAAAPWDVCGSGDINGDGWADLVLCNGRTGRNEVRYLSGATPVGRDDLPSAPPPWRVEAVEDLDGDGAFDLIARNPVTGAVAAGYLKGSHLLKLGLLPPAPPPWEIMGAGDFDGDGRSDIVLHKPSTGENAVWYMNNRSRLGTAELKSAPPGWRGISGRR